MSWLVTTDVDAAASDIGPFVCGLREWDVSKVETSQSITSNKSLYAYVTV